MTSHANSSHFNFPDYSSMTLLFALIASFGSAIVGLGMASVFTRAAASLPFLPGSEMGKVLLAFGLLLVAGGLVGLSRAKPVLQRLDHPAFLANGPRWLRLIECVSLLMSAGLFFYGLFGVCAKILIPSWSSFPLFIFVLYAAAGAASAWRSMKNLGVLPQSRQ